MAVRWGFGVAAVAVLAAAGEPERITIERAVERALERHPEVAALRASRPVASREVEAAGALRAPELRVTTNNIGIDPETLNIRHSVGVRWSPPRPGELGLRQEVARARERGVEAEVRGAEARLAAAVRQTFRRAALGEERARLAEQAVELKRGMLEVVRRQVAAGLKEAVEVDSAELDLAEAEAERRQVVESARSERRKLARLIDPEGAVEVAPVVEGGVWSSLAAPGDRERVVERAVRQRAEVAGVASRCEEARVEESLARNGRYPWISFAQVTHRVGVANTPGAWSIQVGLDLPFFRSHAAAEARVAAAEGARCGMEARAWRARIRGEVEDAAARMEAAVRELNELERLYAGVAAGAVERARGALAAGRADQLDVLRAESRQLALKNRWLARRLDLTEIEAQYELATGEARP